MQHGCLRDLIPGTRAPPDRGAPGWAGKFRASVTGQWWSG